LTFADVSAKSDNAYMHNTISPASQMTHCRGGWYRLEECDCGKGLIARLGGQRLLGDWQFVKRSRTTFGRDVRITHHNVYTRRHQRLRACQKTFGEGKFGCLSFAWWNHFTLCAKV